LLSDDAERTDYEGDGLFALATKNGLNLSAYAKAYADMDGLSDEPGRVVTCIRKQNYGPGNSSIFKTGPAIEPLVLPRLRHAEPPVLFSIGARLAHQRAAVGHPLAHVQRELHLLCAGRNKNLP
jgi:hypothetical protein